MASTHLRSYRPFFKCVWYYTYLIVITAREGEEGIAEAMAAGADDFVRKPFGVSEVVARIRNGQRTLRLERSLAARIAELEKLRAEFLSPE